MADIIGIIQVKGGVGRSTIATNLAAILSLRKPTALVDCDLPQGTSASWYEVRKSEVPPDRLALATARDHRELVERVTELATTHRYVVIDGPPRLAAVTRAIIVLSRLCLVPLNASAAEIWSTADLVETVKEARQVRNDVDVRLVWNRFRGNTREAQDLSAAARDELKLPELATRLGYRVAYSEALARGLSVDEWLDRTAHAEMRALTEEVRTILKGRHP